MFANGGMLPPVTQSPMASGILGSSAPLIETVNNQQSPDRGVRVSMANGGVARFSNGGATPYKRGRGSYTPSLTLPPGTGETLSQQYTYPRPVDLRSGFEIDRERGIFKQKADILRTKALMGAHPEDFLTRNIRRGFDYFTQPSVHTDQRRIEEEKGIAGAKERVEELKAQPLSYWLKKAGAPQNIIDSYGVSSVDSPAPEETDISFGPQEGPFAEIKAKYPHIPSEAAAEVRVIMEKQGTTDIEAIVESSFPKEWVEEFKSGPGVDESGFTANSVSVAEKPEALTITEVVEEGEGPPEEGEKVTDKDRAISEFVPEEGEPSVESGEPPVESSEPEKVSQLQRLRATFAKKGDTPEAKRELKEYMDEFKDATPEYKGMSEEEKGFTLMEAGLKVMAGQSSNAITNIAEGLKGISKEFVADKKAKRAFDQQVDLSAAKYGLENVKADRVSASALAKERRARVEYVAQKPGVDPRDGRKFAKGDVLTFNAGEVHDGILGAFSAGSVVLPKTFSDIASGVAAAQKALLAGKIKYADYRKDRESYQNDSKNLLSGLQMKLLMGDAAQIIKDDPGNVLGATSFMKKAADSVFNTLGIHKEEDRKNYLKKVGMGSGGDLGKGKEFDALMRQISTKMITQILNEGNRTVSDNDRKRVDELVGAYSDYITNVPGSLSRLQIKMENLAVSIDQGILDASSSMNDIERTYNTTIEARRYDLLQQYKAQRFGKPGIKAGKATGFGVRSKAGWGFKLSDDGVYRRVQLGS
tara:strand:+ start:248 stop:2521 length:2274 start_codon:yes stop_codon:yes gene_type:complete